MLMYGFWNYYVKAKYGYRWIQIAYIKKDDIYKGIQEDVETRFDTSNYELDRPLSKGKKR